MTSAGAGAGEFFSEISPDEPVTKKSKFPHCSSDYEVDKFVLPYLQK